jgi:hypothetical protein
VSRALNEESEHEVEIEENKVAVQEPIIEKNVSPP